MLLTSANLVDYLVIRGLLSARSAAANGIVVTEIRRRNRAFNVSLPGKGLFVKQAESPQVSLMREATLLRLADSLPNDMGSPRLLDCDPANRTLVTESFGNCENLTDHRRRTGTLSPALAGLLGKRLGHLHAAPLPGTSGEPATFPGELPRVLLSHLYGWLTLTHERGPGAALVPWLRHCPELLLHLDALRGEWRHDGLIHGDMKWDNCLLIPLEHGEVDLRIVDWEHADVGDPGWDVAGALASYLVDAITSQDASAANLDSLRLAFSQFWDAYVSARNLRPAEVESLQSRAIRYAAARLVQSAFEHAIAGTQWLGAALNMLRSSLTMLRDPEGAMASLGPSPAARELQVPAIGKWGHATPLPDGRGSAGHARLLAVLEAVEIISPAAFTFLGGPPIDVHGADTHLGMPSRGPVPDSPLVRVLLRTIYDHAFSRPLEEGLASPPLFIIADADPAFTALLDKASRPRRVDRCRPSEGQPGFHFTLGDATPDPADAASTLRIYFHATHVAAPLLVETFGRLLNRRQVPFRIKCPSHPASYQRADAVVLYVARRHFGHIAAILAERGASLTALLRPAVSLFTRQLLPGVGLAEDPATGESFGQNRCRLVAEGLVDARMQGMPTLEARLDAVRRRFSTAGIDLERPYLSPGSVDRYELPEREFIHLTPSRQERKGPST
jgi:hypothetical protein